MPKLTRARWYRKMHDRVMQAQHAEIKRRLGEERADNANYGWGDASDGTRVDVATKVYGSPCEVLCTVADYPEAEFRHEWSRY